MKLSRNDIHLISRLSNWSSEGVARTLEEQVYHDALAWKKFLRIAIICLAVGFTTAGLIFFFAYNWAGMHRFLKLALAEAVLMATIIVPLFLRLKGLFKKIILTGGAVLVGVLFGLFGQIYQTGATAFDFFFGWTLFISIWVFISNFSLTWMLWLGLVNMSLILYANQLAFHWPTLFVFLLLFLVDTGFLIVAQFLSIKNQKLQMPAFMLNTILLLTASISTIGIFIGIYDKVKDDFVPLIMAVIVMYSLGLQQAFSRKKVIYLAVIAMSLIVISATLISKIKLFDEWMYLCNSLFVVISVGFLIKYLMNTQKKWNVE